MHHHRLDYHLPMTKPLLAILLSFLVACDDWGGSSDNLTKTKARDHLEIKGLAIAKPVKEVLAALGVKDDEFASHANWSH